MSRRQLSFVIAAEAVPQAEALLELAGAETIALADAADDPVLEPEPNTAPLWPNVVVTAQFSPEAELESLGEVLRESCAATSISVATLGETAWEPGLRQVFDPQAFGARLWLAPADAAATVPEGRVTVRLHMGFAFGTGRHPTTSLCLDWLDANVRRGDTLIDYGCGSGVLAIAALALGATRAWAVDNDPQAVAATRANADLNAVADRLFVGAPEILPDIVVDVVAANILAQPLIEHAELFAARVRPGGTLVLSGILERQAASVVAAYERTFAGFEHSIRDGWARITCTRLAARPT